MNSPMCHFLSPVCDVKHNQIFDEKRMIALTNSCHEQMKSEHNIEHLLETLYLYKHIHNQLKYQFTHS